MRGQIPCYVLGQAAGVTAAVAVRSMTGFRDVDIKEVQRALLAQDAYLGGSRRLAALGLD